MKNLKIKSAIQYQGKHVPPGTVLNNVDNALAAELVSYGKAEVVKPSAPKVDNRDPKELEKREAEKAAAEKAPAKKAAKNAKKAE